MPVLRLAGAGLKLLGGKGLGGQIAREVAGTAALGGAIAGAPAIYDAATGNAYEDAIKRLSTQNPVDGESYRLGLGDQLLNLTAPVFGQEKITDKSIGDYKDKVEKQSLEKEYKPVVEGLGGVYDDTKTKGQILEQVGDLKEKDRRDKYTTSPEYLDAINQRDYNRTIAEIAREDRLAAQSENRQDRLLARRQDLDLNLANLAFKEAESKRQFDLQSKRAHKEKMASIIAGLAGLGGAFAI